MLRSMITRVIFLIAIAASALFSVPSARAEMPFKAWLAVAVDSLDHQIGQQNELSLETFGLLHRRAKENFDRILNQCRIGVGGTRGLQLVRMIDLFVELRDSGVAGLLASSKNWNCPLENYVLQRCPMVQANAPALQRPVVEKFSAALEHCRSARRLFHSALARLSAQANTQMARLEMEVYRPAQSLVQAVSQPWGKWKVTATDQNRPVLAESRNMPVADNFLSAKMVSYWQEVSHFAQAKLNWLTSKVRHIAEACLKGIEPQFLILEFEPLA